VWRSFTAGFLGALCAVLVGAAIWMAAHPAAPSGLLWGGTVYTTKPEFQAYLRTRGLSYATWLKRNPGVAPWEPHRRVPAATPRDRALVDADDWKTGLLLAANALVLALVAVLLLDRLPVRRAYSATRPPTPRRGRGALGLLAAGARAGARHVTTGAIALAQAAGSLRGRAAETSAHGRELGWYAIAASAAIGVFALVATTLGH
jgi:hypothetical protein